MGPQNQDNCTTITDPSESAEFVRLMIGDVDFSCSDCIHNDGIGSLPIIADTGTPNAIKFNSPTNERIYSFSLILDVANPSDILGVSSSLPNMEYAIVDGQLKIIWLDPSEGVDKIYVPLGQQSVEIQTLNTSSISSLQEGSYINTLSSLNSLTSISPRSVEQKLKSLNIGSFQRIDVDERSTRIELNLYDMMGRIVDQNISENVSDYISFIPNVSNGVYLLHVDDGYTNKSYKVFISQK